MSTTDSDCKVDVLASEDMQIVSGWLSAAGFNIVSDAARADARVSFRVNMDRCGRNGARGGGALAIDPGAVVSGAVGITYDDPTSQFWAGNLVKRLIESPQVIALARSKSPVVTEVASAPPTAAPGAALAAVPPAGALPAPTPVSPRLATGTPQSNAYALVVGIEKYRDAPPPDGAREDAASFKALATSTLGVPDGNVHVLVDDRASKSDLERELVWLKANVPANGKIFFFFAGHGAPDAADGTAYLLPYDGSAEAIKATGLPLGTVMHALSDTKAGEVVAFVDTCFSGAGGRSVLPKGARALVRVKEQAPAARVALFAAASGAQISGPAADGRGGLFTRMLVDGIGSASADIDGDGTLTLEEVAQWVTPRVAREAQRQSREQRPVLTLPRGAAPGSFAVAHGVTRPRP